MIGRILLRLFLPFLALFDELQDTEYVPGSSPTRPLVLLVSGRYTFYPISSSHSVHQCSQWFITADPVPSHPGQLPVEFLISRESPMNTIGKKDSLHTAKKILLEDVGQLHSDEAAVAVS